MSTETDGLDTIDTAHWAAKLARGDGQGIVPVAVAKALWRDGLITHVNEPTPWRRSSHLFVRLTEEAAHDHR